MKLDNTLWRWRIRRILRRNPIPHHIWHNVTRHALVLRELDAVKMAHLRELATWFIDRKSIIGVQGLEVTPPMRVAVAAQACLLILNLGVEYFDGWIEVILYPGAFRGNHEKMDSFGLVHNEESALSGESWLRGPVILSWDDVERDVYHGRAGYNVVLHEFAHKLDGLNGGTNGMPPLHGDMHREQWTEAMSAAYDALCLQVAAGESAFINPYAATSPAEFFAVLSEYFFTAPDILKKECPSVYRQLALFYRQESLH
ncbi:MAG: zinc-dependent peptidase [Gammaproteobacteria bacterium]